MNHKKITANDSIVYVLIVFDHVNHCLPLINIKMFKNSKILMIQAMQFLMYHMELNHTHSELRFTVR